MLCFSLGDASDAIDDFVKEVDSQRILLQGLADERAFPANEQTRIRLKIGDTLGAIKGPFSFGVFEFGAGLHCRNGKSSERKG